LLSDVSYPYPYFNLDFKIGPFSWNATYAQLVDLNTPKLFLFNRYNKKYGLFHYLNMDIGKKFKLGLFESIIYQPYDSTGKKVFEMSYLTPFAFLRPAEYSVGSPDNALVGLNLSYQLRKKTLLYSQLLLDELVVSELLSGKGWWGNKYGIQLGLKSFQFMGIHSLFAQHELNLVRPFTYSHRSSLLNYGNMNDALTHPMGANFIELVNIYRYTLPKLPIGIRSQLNVTIYGTDSTANIGDDIYQSYETRKSEYGNTLLQGNRHTLVYFDNRISYLINKRINFRVEVGYIFRLDHFGENNRSVDNIFSIGIRSGFRNIYFDR
jgi:hypothetical protein